jgi:putative Holliday junction resolvase
MAVDIGQKWLGVAISDPLRLIASPFTSIKCQSEEEIINVISEITSSQRATMLVIGLPISLDGTIGPQANTVLALAKNIGSRISIPVAFQDERLSTSQAAEIMSKNKSKLSTRDDAIAAAVILQDYLNGIRFSGNMRLENSPSPKNFQPENGIDRT